MHWEAELAESQAGMSSDVQLPWSHYLTVYSGERDESSTGRSRIRVNQSDLGVLHRELGTVFEPSWANFVIAYRQYGPATQTGEATDASSLSVDLSKPPQRIIASPLELIGVQVAVPTDNPDKKLLVASPFPDDPGQMREYLPKLMDLVTVRDGMPITGRVNINLADRDVLMGVPGIDTALAERILSARSLVPLSDPSRQHGGLAVDGRPCRPPAIAGLGGLDHHAR